jgi:hypothetical protein
MLDERPSDSVSDVAANCSANEDEDEDFVKEHDVKIFVNVLWEERRRTDW